MKLLSYTQSFLFLFFIPDALYLCHLLYFRSYIDVNQMDSHLMSPVDSFDSEDQTLYWHEDSKPGTIV